MSYIDWLITTSLKKINGPENLRKFKVRDIKIQDLVPEGTIVKVGDYVARLDPTEVNEQIRREILLGLPSCCVPPT